jgi:AraC family transcriptional regulator
MALSQDEDSLKELEALKKIIPFAPFATSYGMGWKGLQAVRNASPVGEFTAVGTPLPHVLVLSLRPPEKMDLRYEEVKRDRPLPAGSITVVLANSSVLVHWLGSMDALLVYLEPRLVARVAAQSFEFDPTRTLVQPVDGLNLPQSRSAMLAVDAELRAGGLGGPLLIESLATVLSVHLIRYITGRYRLPASGDGVLSRRRLHMVIEYIMENLEGSPTLERMAAVAHLSPYHFARHFRATTGLAPHQYLIARRIERAQHLLRTNGELGLAEVALRAGFSDQSKFSFHFKRLIGVTPRQFRLSARIA